MRILSQPITGVVVALVVAGLAAGGFLDNNLALAIVLWVVAAAIAGWSLWRVQRKRPVARSDPARDLVVSVVEERFTPFDHKAPIAEIKVSAYNNSKRQLDLTGFAFNKADPYSFALQADAEVQSEVHRLKAPRARIAGLIDPGETTFGWHVHAFPHMPEGGRPGYEIYVEDAVGDTYGVQIPRRSGRDYVRVGRN
jgi:hypothetical protein